ncbi:hypothetical protein ACH4JS_26625 [Streptomyces sp. NPDC017638]|uniref:hypothetical protein n=1 Tax=Streptomyces sp. NPDC017638 TaxID=3365004 RepID=UPI0037873155
MSQPSHDARAVVRALDALTTQIRRLADTRQSGFVMTPTDDSPRCVCGDPIELTGDPARWVHRPIPGKPALDAHTVRLPDGIPEPGPVGCAHPGPHPGFTCAEVDASQPYFRVRWDQERRGPAVGEDQMLRWARREALLVLATRVQHGRTLTEDEARILRQHVETEMREAETARAELEQAQAAIERVRALHQPQPDGSGFPDSQQCPTCSEDGGDGYLYLVRSPCPTARALDGTEQPTTLAPQDGTAS